MATAAPASAETNPYPQPSLPAHQLNGTGVFDTQTFYVYMRAGETLTADAGTLTGLETDSYTRGLSEARIVVTAPSGTQLAAKNGLGLYDTGRPTDAGPVQLVAPEDGIYLLTVGPTAARYNNAQRPWVIEVSDASGRKPGRVFVTAYQMGQPTYAFSQDISFWAVSEQGYQHRIDLPKYNGWTSVISANAYGNVDRATCQPTYASDLRSQDTATGDAAACGGSYLLFFEAPSADLPENAAIPAASPLAGGAPQHWLRPGLVEPTVSNLSFDPDGTTPRSGTLHYSVDDHEGTYAILIDADGDGSYDGPLDRRVPASSAQDLESFAFDGLDANGAVIAGPVAVGFRVEVTRAAEIHLVLSDVETMAGGVKVTRLNGSGIADDRIYWNDSMFADYASCSPKPAIINSLPDGVPVANAADRGWLSTNGACNNSNNTQTGTWGNQKSLDTWTYGKVDVHSEVRYGGVAAFTLQKATSNGTSFEVGQEVHYRFTVTNTGTVGLTDVVIDDPLLGITGFVCAADLPVDASATCDAPVTYTTTADDAEAGTVTNTATSDATPGPGAAAPDTQTSSAEVTVVATPPLTADLALTKRASAQSVGVGDEISYSFTVENTGEAPLTNVVIDDPLLGIEDFVCAAELAPSAKADCTAPSTHRATEADLAAGSVTNHASATGTAETGEVSAEAEATVRVTDAGIIVPPGEDPDDPQDPERPITVTPAPGDDLPTTGGAPLGGIAAGAIALLVAGGIALAVRRRSGA